MTAPPPHEEPLRVPIEGTIVALELVDVDRVWRSRVEVQQGRELVVIAPTRPMGPPILPEPGRGVVVGWPSAWGYLEAQARLTRADAGDIATWVLDVERSALSQRRAAFRLDARLALTITVDRVGEVPATTRNLSEGGLACELPLRHELDAGTPLGFALQLPDGRLVGQGMVIRAVRMVPDGTELGIAFDELDPAEAERLRQYVFEEQLARRASGLR
ncbi:hypothetical protein GCM10011354_12360 [Egicoccus halophilus]|uniref:PilZ domain-containing protein n=2 Tax=Egicoccus halophilus TaxID=1670830 RepID=A0A8J3A738_9ACTN|nr:hypothetical protein GCM10011354_12360 [Egicoccus halophilus]